MLIIFPLDSCQGLLPGDHPCLQSLLSNLSSILQSAHLSKKTGVTIFPAQIMGGATVPTGQVPEHGLWIPPYLPAPLCPAFSRLDPLLLSNSPSQGLSKGLTVWVMASALHDLFLTASNF